MKTYTVSGFIVEAPGMPKLVEWSGRVGDFPVATEIAPHVSKNVADVLDALIFDVTMSALEHKALKNLAYRQAKDAFTVGDVYLWIDARPKAPELSVVQ